MDFQFDDEMCSVVSNKSETTENFGPERPQQYNDANESSQLVAATSSAHGLAEAMDTQLHIDGYEDNYARTHKAPSDMSHHTTSTDATTVGNFAGSNMDFTTPIYNMFPNEGLTESLLAKHDYNMNAINPGDMGAWLHGAGPGCIDLAILAHHKDLDGRHAPRSKPSQASDASYDLVPVPPTDAGRGLDIRSAGALFDEQSFRPFVYNRYLDM